MKLLSICVLFIMLLTTTNSKECPKPSEWYEPLDKDGIMLCPNDDMVWMSKCAFNQTNTWKDPTAEQNQTMINLINSLKKHKPKNIINNANLLGLRVCRKIVKKNNVIVDKYLALITKSNVTNYSGPFIYWRELNPSKFIFIVPHNGIDGTESILRLFERTNTFIMLSNGQKKNLSKIIEPCSNRPISDISHSTQNLAWIAHQQITNDTTLYIKEIQFHGKSKRGITITNGFSRPTKSNSFLYNFAQIIYNQFQYTSDNVKDTLQVCANGTVLKRRIPCGIMQAWVQTRGMTKSKDPNCKYGMVDNDNVLGLEIWVRWIQDMTIMIPIIKELELIYK